MARYAFAALAFLVACKVSDAPSEAPSTSTNVLATAFTTSASSASVPRDLLVAIAKVEDGLRVPQLRDVNEDDAIPTAGPMQLRHAALNSLARGAVLVASTEDELRHDADRALTAGALVLAELGRAHGASDDLASWAPALATLSGFADEAHRQAYVHQVFATLARGGTFEGRDGPIDLPAHDLPPSLTLDLSSTLHFAANAQYTDAEWVPTSCKNKCDPTRNGQSVEMVVIHDTEGGWTASVATLQNDPQKSVQYIVDVNGKVAQFVTEDVTAWHSGNRYYNERSVGIEHVGYSTKPYPEAQYAASAKLVDYLATKYQVPRDRTHIIGHDQVPNGTKMPQGSDPCEDAPRTCEANTSYGGASHHTDPGVWEWSTYMARFDGTAKCNDATSPWTCSTGTTSRYRCAGDAVAVESCNGTACVPGAGDASTDGVCGTKPATTQTPPRTVAPDASTTNDEAPPADSGGCAATPAETAETTMASVNGSVLLGTVVALLAWRRRRRHGPLDGMDVVVR